ncbi:hypothetical protein OSCI_3600016 [Kamptonema sp. PCC 6506]|nr:hypothetical protein OSCI_3600016 [Kamptonema sp. PCC 6506]
MKSTVFLVALSFYKGEGFLQVGKVSFPIYSNRFQRLGATMLRKEGKEEVEENRINGLRKLECPNHLDGCYTSENRPLKVENAILRRRNYARILPRTYGRAGSNGNSAATAECSANL